MSSAIANALSGLDANSTAINVVSGNLANLNTTGYKDVQVSFEDLVNQSLSGFTNSSAVSGSTVAQTTQEFSQGTLETTGGSYDAAIQGGGFFVVQQPSGATEYTRQGNFQVNAAGDLMTSTGQYVQGWNGRQSSEYDRTDEQHRAAEHFDAAGRGDIVVHARGEPGWKRRRECCVQLAHPNLRRAG